MKIGAAYGVVDVELRHARIGRLAVFRHARRRVTRMMDARVPPEWRGRTRWSVTREPYIVGYVVRGEAEWSAPE